MATEWFYGFEYIIVNVATNMPLKHRPKCAISNGGCPVVQLAKRYNSFRFCTVRENKIQSQTTDYLH